MKVVFLIIDYVPHQVLTISKLIKEHNVQVMAYHVARFNNNVPALDNFITTRYDTLSKQRILKDIISLEPDLIVVAGWMIPEYVWIAKKLRRTLNIPIVSYSDTQWYGTLRQRINTMISPFHVKKAFTHIWVSGLYQFEYARRLGFDKKNIILNSLTADVDLFSTVDIEAKLKDYPKNFVYIGRFSEEKGLDILVKAWSAISNKRGWTLTLIGDGPLGEYLKKYEAIVIKDYMDQPSLINEVQNSGCFILPSLREPWALVIHEAAAAGLPIICTNICGAAPHFVINNYNGFTVAVNNQHQIQEALLKIINMTSLELYRFSCRSRELGMHINPKISLNSLLQVI